MTTTIPGQSGTNEAIDDLQIIQTPPSTEDAHLLIQMQIAATMSGAWRGLELLRTFEKPPTLAQALKRFPRGSEEQGCISAFLGMGETTATFVRQGLVSEALVQDLYSIALMWGHVEKIAKGIRRESGEPRMYENFEWLAKRPINVGRS